MATETYDAVIIGSGHNGLIVGNYLAMAGLSVCVLEAKNVIGGCTATVECTLPGFKHDIGSVALGAIQSNPVYADDELGIPLYAMSSGLRISALTGNVQNRF